MKTMVNKICNKNTGLLIMRIGLGGIFVLHGTLKLVYMSTTVSFFSQLGFGPFWAWVVALVEVIAGLMMLVGVFTWVAGLLLAIVMIVAFIRVKLPLGGMQAFMAGEIDIALFIMAIGLGFTGPGRYALQEKCTCGKCWMCKCKGDSHVCAADCTCTTN